ncbi:MAG TPA: glycerol-3-phosphate 1-O-acyltransferase PlsY [Chitinophagaceae bacterium]|nr:glycerol-3-phosphate 1-O-acyltransferase PlsY [Chitinophagaceae bacterium]
MNEILLLTLAYLLGSIPTSVWLSQKLYNIDIRNHGSGNAGATNSFRVIGKKAGAFVMLIDMLKGFLAVKLVYLSLLPIDSVAFVNLQVSLGLCAVVGHIFPIWAGFRGGKGIATLFGMIIAINPWVALSMVAVFIVILLLTKYVSLSSIVASISFPFLIFVIFREQTPEIAYKLFAIGTALLVILTHHKNISRLIQGNENKVNLKKKNKNLN